MLAIMTALDEWHHHLLGAKLQFEIGQTIKISLTSKTTKENQTTSQMDN